MISEMEHEYEKSPAGNGLEDGESDELTLALEMRSTVDTTTSGSEKLSTAYSNDM